MSVSYVVSACCGGVVGGLGHAVLSPDVTFGRKTQAGRDLSWLRDLTVGLFSGLVWLIPNQKSWFESPSISIDALILIALQTMLIGLAGSGWLTAQLSSASLKGAVISAAGSTPNQAIAAQIAQAQSTHEVEHLVSTLYQGASMPCKINAPSGGGVVFSVVAGDLPVSCALQSAPSGITIAAASYQGPNDPAPVDIQPAADGNSFQIPALAAAAQSYAINVTLSGAVALAQIVEDCPAKTILITIAGIIGNFDLQVN